MLRVNTILPKYLFVVAKSRDYFGRLLLLTGDIKLNILCGVGILPVTISQLDILATFYPLSFTIFRLYNLLNIFTDFFK